MFNPGETPKKGCGLIQVEQFYERYGPMVLRRCRQLLRHEQRAVDAMQDTFVLLLRRQHELHDSAPSSLLFRMATNVCLNRLRSEKRRREDGDSVLDDLIDATEHEAQSSARQRLARIFGQETPSTLLIAVLHFVDQMTLEEVAAEVGMSVSGVRKRLRGLKTRAAALEDATASGGEYER